MSQDWARVIAETPEQTIKRVTGYSSHDRPKMVREIKECMAAELEKMAHRYNARMGMVATNNVAYHLTQRATEIRDS
jgi:hypothetical protein